MSTVAYHVSRITCHVSGQTVALVSLLACSLGLRLYGLNAVLWYDEAFSAWLAQLPISNLLTASLGDVHPPLYYLMLWGVTHLVGHTEAALRLPSVLAGVGLVWAVNRLMTALQQDQKAVWLATGLIALSPFQVYYSTEARMYELLMLTLVFSAWRLVIGDWRLGVVGSVVALYLHNLAPLFVGAIWVAALITNYQSPKTILRPAMITALGYAPGLVLALRQAGQVGAGYWIPPVTSPGRIIATLDDLLFFTPNNPFVLSTSLITCLGLLVIATDRRPGTGDRSTDYFLLITSFLPLACVTVVSLLWQPILISRSVAGVAPFYTMLLAVNLARSRRRLVTLAALGGPTLLLILVGPFWGEMGRPPGDEKLLQFYGELQPGDGIYHANVGSYVVWQYYHPEMAQYLWPQETTLKQTLSGESRRAMGMAERDFEEVKCTQRRWWLIQFNNPVTQPAEMEYVTRLLSENPHKQVAVLRSDQTVEAWLYLIEPVCSDPKGF